MSARRAPGMVPPLCAAALHGDCDRIRMLLVDGSADACETVEAADVAAALGSFAADGRTVPGWPLRLCAAQCAFAAGKLQCCALLVEAMGARAASFLLPPALPPEGGAGLGSVDGLLIAAAVGSERVAVRLAMATARASQVYQLPPCLGWGDSRPTVAALCIRLGHFRLLRRLCDLPPPHCADVRPEDIPPEVVSRAQHAGDGSSGHLRRAVRVSLQRAGGLPPELPAPEERRAAALVLDDAPSGAASRSHSAQSSATQPRSSQLDSFVQSAPDPVRMAVEAVPAEVLCDGCPRVCYLVSPDGYGVEHRVFWPGRQPAEGPPVLGPAAPPGPTRRVDNLLAAGARCIACDPQRGRWRECVLLEFLRGGKRRVEWAGGGEARVGSHSCRPAALVRAGERCEALRGGAWEEGVCEGLDFGGGYVVRWSDASSSGGLACPALRPVHNQPPVTLPDPPLPPISFDSVRATPRSSVQRSHAPTLGMRGRVSEAVVAAAAVAVAAASDAGSADFEFAEAEGSFALLESQPTMPVTPGADPQAAGPDDHADLLEELRVARQQLAESEQARLKQELALQELQVSIASSKRSVPDAAAVAMAVLSRPRQSGPPVSPRTPSSGSSEAPFSIDTPCSPWPAYRRDWAPAPPPKGQAADCEVQWTAKPLGSRCSSLRTCESR
eukprot:TRINITY_DN18835_c0_g1_i1.p1 TRINITY_DN18835_c0_g1~~TRINITY_DN18835_c0_g1_i1.p1  ORF type:complete len:685 (+),score=158.91 TRINITY_DN18835_c0_g1_i1:46-2055(+)